MMKSLKAMQQPAASCLCAALLAVFCLSPLAAVAAEEASDAVAQGKQLAFDRKKGNCLACHHIVDGPTPGNIGPALVAMQARFPNRADLRARIWDLTQFVPEAAMPPFGRHKILSEDEIDKIMEYLLTL